MINLHIISLGTNLPNTETPKGHHDIAAIFSHLLQFNTALHHFPARIFMAI